MYAQQHTENDATKDKEIEKEEKNKDNLRACTREEALLHTPKREHSDARSLLRRHFLALCIPQRHQTSLALQCVEIVTQGLDRILGHTGIHLRCGLVQTTEWRQYLTPTQGSDALCGWRAQIVRRRKGKCCSNHPHSKAETSDEKEWPHVHHPLKTANSTPCMHREGNQKCKRKSDEKIERTQHLDKNTQHGHKRRRTATEERGDRRIRTARRIESTHFLGRAVDQLMNGSADVRKGTQATEKQSNDKEDDRQIFERTLGHMGRILAHGEEKAEAFRQTLLYFSTMAYDPQSLRGEFPMLAQQIDGHALVYLDSAATAQKPRIVLDAMETYYRTQCANIHRGVHQLAEEATVAYETARESIRTHIDAAESAEIIITRGTTESINLVARSMDARLGPGDTVLVTTMEHHSNIVPWQLLALRTGCTIVWIDVDASGTLDRTMMQSLLAKGTTKLIAITGLSNVLGATTPLRAIIDEAHAHGALVLVDAAQQIVHDPLSVRTLDCDFLAFSGHKIYGPTGVGVLYGRRSLLETFAPLYGGGDMVKTVTRKGYVLAPLPRKLEAGTMPIAEVIGLGTALTWLRTLPRAAIAQHEASLLLHARKRLMAIDRITVFGPTHPTGCLSFTVDGVHPHDLTDALGREGICLRAGHHCAAPLHEALGITATTRLSVGMYSTMDEIDRCVDRIMILLTRL